MHCTQATCRLDRRATTYGSHRQCRLPCDRPRSATRTPPGGTCNPYSTSGQTQPGILARCTPRSGSAATLRTATPEWFVLNSCRPDMVFPPRDLRSSQSFDADVSYVECRWKEPRPSHGTRTTARLDILGHITPLRHQPCGHQSPVPRGCVPTPSHGSIAGRALEGPRSPHPRRHGEGPHRFVVDRPSRSKSSPFYPVGTLLVVR